MYYERQRRREGERKGRGRGDGGEMEGTDRKGLEDKQEGVKGTTTK